MPTKSWEWLHRIHFGTGRSVGLGWGMELWKRDASVYEATGCLLDDVVHAAGSIELSLTRLHNAISHVPNPYSEQGTEVMDTGTDHRIFDPAVEEGWYAVE